MDALQLSEVIRIGNAHWPEIFGAETSQALLGDGNADLLDAVDVRDFREDFFLFRIEREDGQVFGVEDAENFFTQIEENMVKIVGSMDLVGDAFDVLGECHFLLKFLKILGDGLGLHYMGSWPLTSKVIAGFVCSMKSESDPRDHKCLEAEIEFQSS